MPESERLTITLPADIAAIVKDAVADGGYATSSAVVRDALQHWNRARVSGAEKLAALEDEIDLGLQDIVEGRVADFSVERILKRGELLLASRSNSKQPQGRKPTFPKSGVLSQANPRARSQRHF